MKNKEKLTNKQKDYIRNQVNKKSIIKITSEINSTLYLVRKFIKEESLIIQKDNIFTDELIEQIKDLLKHNNVKEVSKMLEIDYYKLRNFVKKNELTWFHRNWSEEHSKYIIENWGIKSREQIAKDLGVTENKIVNFVGTRRLGNRSKVDSNYYTLSQIKDILGIKHHIITCTFKDKGLNIINRELGKSKYLSVLKEDFMNFLENNQELWDSKKVKLNAFGYEPEWLTIKRKKDKKINYNTKTKWTKRKEQDVLSLYYRGCTKKRIGEIMKIPRHHVTAKLEELGISVNEDYIYIPKIVKLTGLNASVIKGKWVNRGLKLYVPDFCKETSVRKYAIKEELLGFMEENQDLFEIEQLDEQFFCNVKWFQEAKSFILVKESITKTEDKVIVKK